MVIPLLEEGKETARNATANITDAINVEDEMENSKKARKGNENLSNRIYCNFAFITLLIFYFYLIKI